MTNREATADVTAYGVWTEAVEELITYRYLGCRSVLHEGFEATGRMPLRRDMRLGTTLLGAPVAIAMMDTAGIAVDRHWQLALTRAEVNLVAPSPRLATLGVRGALTRQARNQIFTEAQFIDADRPDVTVGFGTADWTVMSSTPMGFDYRDPGEQTPDDVGLGPLTAAYGAAARDDGAFVIEELTNRLGGRLLHHGPILVTLEAAALAQINRPARVDSLSVRIVRAGKRAPFHASAHVVTATSRTALVRADLTQSDDENSLVATATVRVHLRGVARA